MSLQTRQSKAEAIKEKAKSDLFFFCKEILGYSLIHKQPHQEFCDFMTNEKKLKKLVLMPRGSFKSSIITIGYVLWKLVNDNNIRILISSETYAQSRTFLKAIKTHIEQNEVFRGIFGDLKPPNLEVAWRQDEISINGRTKVSREPSIMCSGVGQTRVGLHYDLIVLDDVVSDKNINTPEQINKIIEHYRLLLSILDPGKELVIVGTRYSYADLYGHILEQEKDSFAIHKRAAYLADGSLLFPSRLTKDYLAGQKKSMGSSHFANQYMNEPIDDDAAMFRSSWLRYYTDTPKELRHFLLVDPSASQEKYSDYTAMVVCGIDPYNNIYVREAIQIKPTVKEMMNRIFSLMEQYDIIEQGCLAIETNANQQTYKYIISEEQNKRQQYFAIKELKPSSVKSKANRIKALQPYFENGKIYYRKEHTELIDQTTMYPRTRHDDLIDALASVLQVMSPAEVVEKDKWEESTLTRNEIEVWKEREEMAKPRYIKRTKLRF